MLRDLRSETKLAREKHERELNKLSKEHSFKVSLVRNYCCTNLGVEQLPTQKCLRCSEAEINMCYI